MLPLKGTSYQTNGAKFNESAGRPTTCLNRSLESDNRVQRQSLIVVVMKL